MDLSLIQHGPVQIRSAPQQIPPNAQMCTYLEFILVFQKAV